MQWILRTDQPFTGTVQSFLNADGTVAYSDGLTLEQYAADRRIPLRLIDDAELGAMSAAYLATLVTPPIEETEAKFEYALGVLPPSKWRTARGVESFHICERITGNLVSWHARCGNRFFTFNDYSSLTAEEVAAKVGAHV